MLFGDDFLFRSYWHHGPYSEHGVRHDIRNSHSQLALIADFPFPTFTRLGILSQEANSSSRPKTAKPLDQREGGTQISRLWFSESQVGSNQDIQ